MELLHQSGDVIMQRYRILDTLGQGGSGTTYLAQDQTCDRSVALKALSLHRMTDWKMIELFEREARILAQLNHPAIPDYLEYFHIDTPQDRFFYIAQQLAEGESLAALVQNGWRTSEEEVRRIAIQILEILVYLHSLTPPVVHRDIKPQNIIRRQDGQVCLVDFGAVQQTYHDTLMRGSTVVGTYGYMAPEQFRGQAVPATDLYGLAATLLFLLTHRSPAELPTDRLKINFRSRVKISEEFADWLEKMLEPDLEDRFGSAKEALLVLRGKKKIRKQSGASVSWKAIAGIGVATVVGISVLNSYKWGVLSSFGFTPSVKICQDDNVMRNYLNEAGNPNAVISYIDSGDDLATTTLLECAVRANRTNIAQTLIAKGANVNSLDQGGKTPLSYATSEEMRQLLIAHGAK